MPQAQGLLGIKPGIILNTALTNINNIVVINNTLTVINTPRLPTFFLSNCPFSSDQVENIVLPRSTINHGRC